MCRPRKIPCTPLTPQSVAYDIFGNASANLWSSHRSLGAALRSLRLLATYNLHLTLEEVCERFTLIPASDSSPVLNGDELLAAVRAEGAE